ncbi:MAG TPA: molybdopterin-guanine dinucleotide biosynthesis protein B [Candidatus Saccharimonadales bacterium]|nr:molybdopterin-guanine dinucleotide biosynthesis protein B [Candidatus Saccharimonadales bacterium]
MTVPEIAFVGRHNSGKTTFLLAVLPHLIAAGLRVGYLKHASAGFDIDHPAKDSYRVRRSGVLQTIVAGDRHVAVIDDAGARDLRSVVDRYVRSDLDLLVIEGFKREPVAKIEVARVAIGRELLCAADPLLLATVADFPVEAAVPAFALDDAAGVAELIRARIGAR